MLIYRYPFIEVKKITRTVTLLKSNCTKFLIKVRFYMIDMKIFTTGTIGLQIMSVFETGGAVGRGKCFFDRVTILFHHCNNTNITYQQFYSCLCGYFTHS